MLVLGQKDGYACFFFFFITCWDEGKVDAEGETGANLVVSEEGYRGGYVGAAGQV